MTALLNRRVGAAVAMSLLLLLAGCSGGFGPGDSTTTETTATDSTTTEVDRTTDTTNATTAGETTASETTSTSGGTTVANGTTVAPGANDSATTGRLLVVLDGRDVHLESANASSPANGSVWLDANDSHVWHAANESVPLADALGQLGMDANASSVTYDGTTYRDGNDTTVSYRVNGEAVEDLEAYDIEDGDQVFVTVHTSNASTPGRYFDASHPHPHGTLNVTVGGTPVNFTEQKYTHADRYFHFHGDEGAERWHAHSMNLTPAYAISTFPGLNLTNDTFTYENETYRRSDDGVNISVTVNGESVDPATYVLKDGDDLRIAVEGPAVESESETANETETEAATEFETAATNET